MTTFERVIPVLVCRDIQAAHDFLVRAFGFDPGGVERARDGQPVHGEVVGSVGQPSGFTASQQSTISIHRKHQTWPAQGLSSLSATLTPTVALLATIVLALVPAQAQQAPSLVGSWRLVSYEQSDSTGQRRDTWGNRPLGLIIYQADGTMSAHGFDERRPSLRASVDSLGAPAALAAAFTGLFAYYGSYSVDTVARQVTHRVEGAWNSDWIGSAIVRSYRFIDRDHVELRVVRNPDGRVQRNGAVLLWERVKR